MVRGVSRSDGKGGRDGRKMELTREMEIMTEKERGGDEDS
jgi:hypothetical protein